MSVNSTRNSEMVEALSADFRRLYNPTHALGDAIDMMNSLPVCRAIYPGSANGGRVSSAAGVPEAPNTIYQYMRGQNSWNSGGLLQNPLFVDGVIRTRQSGSTRYRSDRFMSGAAMRMDAFDDTGSVYIPMRFDYGSQLTLANQTSNHILQIYTPTSEFPYISFYNSTNSTRQGLFQGRPDGVGIVGDGGNIHMNPLSGESTRVHINRVTGTTNSPRINFVNSANNFAAFIQINTTSNDLELFANATNTGVVMWANATVQARFGFGGASGMTVGPAGGGALGVGRINVSSGIFLNNSVYANPDYALEYWATGEIVRFANNVGADGYKRLSLGEMEEHIREHLRLPRITDEPMDIFDRADRVLEFIEELYTHVIELHHRIRELENE